MENLLCKGKLCYSYLINITPVISQLLFTAREKHSIIKAGRMPSFKVDTLARMWLAIKNYKVLPCTFMRKKVELDFN